MPSNSQSTGEERRRTRISEWRKEAELTAEEHKRAEELIHELQDRLETLKERKQAKHPKKFGNYQKDIWDIETTHGKVRIKHGQGEIDVSLNGELVIKIVGMYLVGIKFDKCDKALSGVRAKMILDDIALL